MENKLYAALLALVITIAGIAALATWHHHKWLMRRKDELGDEKYVRFLARSRDEWRFKSWPDGSAFGFGIVVFLIVLYIQWYVLDAARLVLILLIEAGLAGLVLFLAPSFCPVAAKLKNWKQAARAVGDGKDGGEAS